MLLYWILLPIVWVLAHILWRFEVIGREHLKSVQDGRPYVIAANHIANLDPVFILIEVFSWRRLYIPAKEELFKNPLAGWFLHCMGAVSIDRGKGDTVTLERLTEECKNGTGVLIFPEGTRTKTGKLGVLKSGAFVIAGAAGADMVPCRIIYGSKDGKMHLFCKIRIVFGEPIPAAELQVTDTTHKIAALRRMKNRLRDDLEQLLAENAFPALPAAEEKPAIEPPAAPPAAQPAVEQPAIEQPAAPPAAQPAVEQPAIEQPAAPEAPAAEEQPVPEQPAAPEQQEGKTPDCQ